MYYCLTCENLFEEPVERYDPVDPSRVEYVCPHCASIDYVDEEELD